MRSGAVTLGIGLLLWAGAAVAGERTYCPLNEVHLGNYARTPLHLLIKDSDWSGGPTTQPPRASMSLEGPLADGTFHMTCYYMDRQNKGYYLQKWLWGKCRVEAAGGTVSAPARGIVECRNKRGTRRACTVFCKDFEPHKR